MAFEIAADAPRARLLAFYLPQFYPIPENDRWWGRGFTEWTNAAQARPLFDGHYQPHLPADLGFYDLRAPEVREAQAALARRHHIEGFCYWHYWFHGTRLLERPFDEVLASGRPDLPFCLSWANETWSRRWHGTGAAHEVLQEQSYSADDDRAHARWLMRAFADARYLRVQGRPLFVVYRPTDLPDPQRTTDILRSECTRAGMPEPYLVGCNSHADHDYRQLGFDATLEFEPQLGLLPGPTADGLKIYDYPFARRRMAARRRDFPVHPCIFVRWDNTPRRGENGIVFINSTPEAFEAGLQEVVERVEHRPFDERIVVINAWNEWAEGNHLEPDLRHGLAYLEAVKRVAVGTVACL
jgi:lipopolysaccharide biosynthesis protein